MVTNSPQPSKTEVDRTLYGLATNLMRQGVSSNQIEKTLTEKGIDQPAARAAVESLSKIRSETIRKAALKNMAVGATIGIIGIMVTLGLYNAAEVSTGGRYIVALGAIIFGGIQFIRGLSQYNRKYSRLD